MSRIIYVALDHLSFDHGAMREADPACDIVALVESERMTRGRNWHPQRLFFMISAARHFASEARARGFKTHYVTAPTTVEGLRSIRVEVGDIPIVCAEPSSFRQMADLADFGVQFVANDFFLTSRHDFALWAGRQKTFVMENFYRAQRARLNILMDGAKPVGGRWNFDADNRLPPPRDYTWPARHGFERDDIDRQVFEDLGIEPESTWATTRAQALEALDFFVLNNLEGFGPYEDAVTAKEWSLHHSLLSPYLNVGLVHASEVVTAALSAYRDGLAPLQSVEAFVRQVIGWREYINGMYWFLGEDYRNLNELNATATLLPAFTDSTKTAMNCVSSTVTGVEARAWVHHIPRLMILSNLALLTGTNPQEFLNWMREQFIDASDWVMVPNVIGMATHADGGLLMTKPYAGGGAYLNRMTEYCRSCPFDPKKRVGDDACPMTTLYWDFLDRHRERFAGNHRMFQQLAGLKKIENIEQVRDRATEVLTGLRAGTL
jgi:deoxyribodipyrimidine photolyase-related protein